MRFEFSAPHINQKNILECDSRFIVLMCGRRFGKSELSQIKLIKTAAFGQQVAYITPTYKLAKTFFSRLSKALPFPCNQSDLKIQFPNNGSVEFFTGERLDNLRGRKFHGVIIDEASFIPNLESGWLNSIRPTLTDYKGWAVFLSTPRGKNFFYSLFLKGEAGEKDWKSFKYTTYHNPYIDPLEIEDAKRQLPHAVFEQEYLANPMENASNPFGIEFINRCIKPLSQNPVAVYGIDIAKSYDWTVIIGLDSEGNTAYFKRFQKDWHSTKQEILNLEKKPVLIDSTGVGDPIYEDLQREGMNIQGLKFTQVSKQQLMTGLQTAIQTQRIGFPLGTIVNELEVFEYQYTATGVKYSAPSGFHDDAVMALALAYNNLSFKAGSGKYSFS
ncbi:MAG: terminase large subunit domain-containing protein [Flavobacterium sp.]